MNESLKGKTAVVTGASRGYGAGIARMLAMRGARVWIAARSQADLKRVAADVGAEPIAADVTSSADWDRLFAAVLDKSKRLDILVNNAGAGVQIAEIADQTDEQIRSCIDVNLTGAAFGSRRAAAQMRKQKSGTIVNVSSVCAVEAWPQWGVYAAAKAGLVQLTRSLYVELRPHGARATCVIPSWGDTEFLRAAKLEGFSPEVAEKCIKPDELGRIVADVCALPAHLVVQEMIVWPLVQDVSPL
ncbi:MAG: SDR family oxidoreductase [Phycisphaerae bacterium]|nr:SDR family oxidoreductase [Phycisphaerae bacterium]